MMYNLFVNNLSVERDILGYIFNKQLTDNLEQVQTKRDTIRQFDMSTEERGSTTVSSALKLNSDIIQRHQESLQQEYQEDFYIGHLEESVRSIYKRIIEDDLIFTLSESKVSSEFIEERIQEIIHSKLLMEKEATISQLLREKQAQLVRLLALEQQKESLTDSLTHQEEKRRETEDNFSKMQLEMSSLKEQLEISQLSWERQKETERADKVAQERRHLEQENTDKMNERKIAQMQDDLEKRIGQLQVDLLAEKDVSEEIRQALQCLRETRRKESVENKQKELEWKDKLKETQEKWIQMKGKMDQMKSNFRETEEIMARKLLNLEKNLHESNNSLNSKTEEVERLKVFKDQTILVLEQKINFNQNQLRSQLEDAQQQLIQQNFQIIDKDTHICKLRDQINAQDITSQTNRDLLKEQRILIKQSSEMQAIMNDSNSEKKQKYQERNAKFLEENNKLQAQYDKQEEKLIQARNEINLIVREQLEMKQELQNSIQLRDDNIQAQQREISKLNTSVKVLNEEISQLSSKYEDMHEQKRSFSQELTYTSGKLMKAEEKCKTSLEEIQKEQERNKNEQALLLSEIKEKDSTISEVRKEIALLDNKYKSSLEMDMMGRENEVNNLKKKLKNVQLNSGVIQDELKEQLKKLERKIAQIIIQKETESNQLLETLKITQEERDEKTAILQECENKFEGKIGEFLIQKENEINELLKTLKITQEERDEKIAILQQYENKSELNIGDIVTQKEKEINQLLETLKITQDARDEKANLHELVSHNLLQVQDRNNKAKLRLISIVQALIDSKNEINMLKEGLENDLQQLLQEAKKTLQSVIQSKESQNRSDQQMMIIQFENEKELILLENKSKIQEIDEKYEKHHEKVVKDNNKERSQLELQLYQLNFNIEQQNLVMQKQSLIFENQRIEMCQEMELKQQQAQVQIQLKSSELFQIHKQQVSLLQQVSTLQEQNNLLNEQIAKLNTQNKKNFEEITSMKIELNLKELHIEQFNRDYSHQLNPLQTQSQSQIDQMKQSLVQPDRRDIDLLQQTRTAIHSIKHNITSSFDKYNYRSPNSSTLVSPLKNGSASKNKLQDQNLSSKGTGGNLSDHQSSIVKQRSSSSFIPNSENNTQVQESKFISPDRKYLQQHTNKLSTSGNPNNNILSSSLGHSSQFHLFPTTNQENTQNKSTLKTLDSQQNVNSAQVKMNENLLLSSLQKQSISASEIKKQAATKQISDKQLSNQYKSIRYHGSRNNNEKSNDLNVSPLKAQEENTFHLPHGSLFKQNQLKEKKKSPLVDDDGDCNDNPLLLSNRAKKSLQELKEEIIKQKIKFSSKEKAQISSRNEKVLEDVILKQNLPHVTSQIISSLPIRKNLMNYAHYKNASPTPHNNTTSTSHPFFNKKQQNTFQIQDI